MNEIKIFNSEEFGAVRTVMLDDEPWFVGIDVGKALGYADPYSGVRKLVDDEDKKGCPVGRGTVQTTVINESGLYALIFGSKLESAKRFKKWVTSEVLPSIRKTGGYLPTTPQGQIKLLAQGMTEMQEQINTVSDTVEAVRSDFDTFKEECPIFPIEADRITQAARSKGIEVMGGKHSMAYHNRSIVQLVYRDIYGEIHRNFGCRSYKEIPRKNVDRAIEIVNRYILPLHLQEKIDLANA